VQECHVLVCGDILGVLDSCQASAGPPSARRVITNGTRADSRDFTSICGHSCTGMVCMVGVGPEWSHNMAQAPALDTRTWPREDVPGFGLIDEDVDLLRGCI
jgi:hypothetical protein